MLNSTKAIISWSLYLWFTKTFTETNSPRDIQYVSYFINQSFLCRPTIPKKPNLRVKSTTIQSVKNGSRFYLLNAGPYGARGNCNMYTSYINYLYECLFWSTMVTSKFSWYIFSGFTYPLYTWLYFNLLRVCVWVLFITITST